MTDDKDYSLGGADRDEWDRLWETKTLRLLPGDCRLDLSKWSASFNVKTVALSDDPTEFAGQGWRESDLCPVCGELTAGCARIAAHLNIEHERPIDWQFKSDPKLWLAVWVHQACFDRCRETGRPAGIPW